MRFLLIILLLGTVNMVISQPAIAQEHVPDALSAFFGGYNRPSQECFSDCKKSAKAKAMIQSKVNQYCTDDCRRLKKIYQKSGTDYKGYKDGLSLQKFLKDNPHPPAYYANIKARAEFYKKCLARTADEDACDDKTEKLSETCVRDCMQKGEAKFKCTDACGEEDPF